MTYSNKRLAKVCTCLNVAVKQYGEEMAVKIHTRVDQLSNARSAEEMVQFRIGRCHPLKGGRNGQYALDLVHPYRLVFEQRGDEMRIANILEITDYH